MHLQRQPIGAPEYLKILDPRPTRSRLPDLILILSPETRSFGAWLEPRYIFGAGQLIDQ